MRETRTSGSVRGASGDGRPYRERSAADGGRCREGPLTDPVADGQACRWELVKMPQSGRRWFPFKNWIRRIEAETTLHAKLAHAQHLPV